MKDHNTSASKIIVVSIIFLLVVTSVYMLYINDASKRTRQFKSSDSEMVLEVSNPEGKIWEDRYRYPGHPCGAEYSFNIFNDDNLRLSNWSVSVELSGPCDIDSSWNGDFSINGNTLTFTPDSELSYIDAGSMRYFGAVIYSRYLLDVRNYTVTGCMPLDPFTMPFTYVLALCYIIWFLYTGSHIIAYARIESLLKQRNHDIEIIDQSIRTLTAFVDAKDRYTRNHSVRVAVYAKEIGRRLGLDDDELMNLYYGTLLHDVGKIGIPDEILRNKGRLNDKEYEIIKTHPGKGVEMLESFNAIPNIADCAHYHHERYDGKGYPEKLKGENIPLFARIASVADAYDAMSSDRRYRKSFEKEKIISEFNENSGTQFDPKLVPVMIEMINDGFVEKVAEEYAPEDD